MDTQTKIILLVVILGAAVAGYFLWDRTPKDVRRRGFADEEWMLTNKSLMELQEVAQDLERMVREFDTAASSEVIETVKIDGVFPGALGKVIDDLGVRMIKLESEFTRLMELDRTLMSSRAYHYINETLPEFKKEYSEFAALEDQQALPIVNQTLLNQQHVSQHISLNADMANFDQSRPPGGRRIPQLAAEPTFSVHDRIGDFDQAIEKLKKPEQRTITGPVSQSAFNVIPLNANNAILNPESAETKTVNENNKRADEDTREDGFIPKQIEAKKIDASDQTGAEDFNTQAKGDLPDTMRIPSGDTFNTEMNPVRQDETPPPAPDVEMKMAEPRPTEGTKSAKAFNQDGRSTNNNDVQNQKAKTVLDAMAGGTASNPIELLEDNEETVKALSTKPPAQQATERMNAIKDQVYKYTGFGISGASRQKGTLKRSTSTDQKYGRGVLLALESDLRQIPISLYNEDFTQSDISAKVEAMRKDAPQAELVQVYDAWAPIFGYVNKARRDFQGKTSAPTPLGRESKRSRTGSRKLLATRRKLRRV